MPPSLLRSALPALLITFLLLLTTISITHSQLISPGFNWVPISNTVNVGFTSTTRLFTPDKVLSFVVTSTNWSVYPASNRVLFLNTHLNNGIVLVPINPMIFSVTYNNLLDFAGRTDVFVEIHGCTNILTSCSKPRRLGIIVHRARPINWFMWDSSISQALPFVTGFTCSVSNPVLTSQERNAILTRLGYNSGQYTPSNPALPASNIITSYTDSVTMADTITCRFKVPDRGFLADTMANRRYQLIAGSLNSDYYTPINFTPPGPSTPVLTSTLPSANTDVEISFSATDLGRLLGNKEQFMLQLQQVGKITGYDTDQIGPYIALTNANLDSFCGSVMADDSNLDWDGEIVYTKGQLVANNDASSSCTQIGITKCSDQHKGPFCDIVLETTVNCPINPNPGPDGDRRGVGFGELDKTICSQEIIHPTLLTTSSTQIDIERCNSMQPSDESGSRCFSLAAKINVAITSLNDAGLALPISAGEILTAAPTGVINIAFSGKTYITSIQPIFTATISGKIPGSTNWQRVQMVPVDTGAFSDQKYLDFSKGMVQFSLPPLFYSNNARVDLEISYPGLGTTPGTALSTKASSWEFSIEDSCGGECNKDNYQYCDVSKLSLFDAVNRDFSAAHCRCSAPLIDLNEEARINDPTLPLLCGVPCGCLNGGKCLYPTTTVTLPHTLREFTPTPQNPIPPYSLTTIDADITVVSYSPLIDQRDNVDIYWWMQQGSCECQLIPGYSDTYAKGQFCQWNVPAPLTCETKCNRGYLASYEYLSNPLTGDTLKVCPSSNEKIDCKCFNNFGPSTSSYHSEWTGKGDSSDTRGPEHLDEYCTQCSLESYCHLENTHPITFTAERCSLPNASCICKDGYSGDKCEKESILARFSLNAVKDVVIVDSSGQTTGDPSKTLDYFLNQQLQKTFGKNLKNDLASTITGLDIKIRSYDPINRTVLLEISFDAASVMIEGTPMLLSSSSSSSLSSSSLLSSSSSLSTQPTTSRTLSTLLKALQETLPTSLDGLYTQWNDLATNTNSNVSSDGSITNPTPGCLYSSQYDFPTSPSNNNCPETKPTATTPTFDEQYYDSTDRNNKAIGELVPTPDPSPGNNHIAIAIAVPIGIVLFFIVILIILWCLKSSKKLCFRPREKRSKARKDGQEQQNSDKSSQKPDFGPTASGTGKIGTKKGDSVEFSIVSSAHSTTGSAPNATPSAVSANSHQSVVDPSLPSGWNAFKNDHGKVYYINQETMQSSWTHPNAALGPHDDDANPFDAGFN